MTIRKFTSTLAKFTSTLAFKSIQMTYSLKPLHPFHMQHDKAAALQIDKIQAGRESKMAAVAKNS